MPTPEPDEIKKSFLSALSGRRLFYFDSLDSTNSHALNLAARGEPEGTVVVADRQLAGRGRRGRTWVSPPGANLYLSVILRPALSNGAAGALAFMGALAVAGTVEEFSGLRPALKWPNDVLLGGKKMAGILMEARGSSDAMGPLAAGIGVNLNMASADIPPEIREVATSVRAVCGEMVDRAAFAAGLLDRMDSLYLELCGSGPAATVEAFRRRCETLGKRISVTMGGQRRVEGLAEDLDGEGRLMVRLDTGGLRVLSSGEVSLS